MYPLALYKRDAKRASLDLWSAFKNWLRHGIIARPQQRLPPTMRLVNQLLIFFPRLLWYSLRFACYSLRRLLKK